MPQATFNVPWRGDPSQGGGPDLPPLQGDEGGVQIFYPGGGGWWLAQGQVPDARVRVVVDTSEETLAAMRADARYEEAPEGESR